MGKEQEICPRAFGRRGGELEMEAVLGSSPAPAGAFPFLRRGDWREALLSHRGARSSVSSSRVSFPGRRKPLGNCWVFCVEVMSF